MTPGEALVRWSARFAMLLAAAGVASILLRPRSRTEALRYWTLGCVGIWVHVALAFHFLHGWSHAEAERHTAERTGELTGFRSGVGIWANYLVLFGWSAEVLYLRRRSGGDESAAVRWMMAGWRAYFLFIAVNAVVVFETGPTRWIGAAAFTALGVLAIRRAWRPQ